MKLALETYFSENDVQIEIVAEELTLRDFKKLPKYFPDNIPKETIPSEYSSVIELEAFIFEDSAGKNVENLEIGDKVLAKIIDTRDIAHYIGHLIGAKKEQTMIPIPAEVQSIEEIGNEYIVCLKYSDLIFGIAHVDRGRTLKVLETKDPTTWQTKFLSYYSNDIKKNKI